MDGIFGKNFDHPKFRNAFGQILINKILNSPCIFYDGDSNELLSFFGESTPYETLENISGTLTSFLGVIWLLKDHSITLGDIIMVIGEVKANSFYIHRRYVLFSNSQGSYVTTELMQNDIELSNSLFAYLASTNRKIENPIEIIRNNTLKDGTTTIRNKINFAAYDYERIQRAMLMLNIGRQASFLPIKISQYVVLLESLTSTDENTEVTHQVSERVANLVGSNKEEKYQIYKDVKEAYSIRSKFLHGQKLKHRHGKKMIPISMEYMSNVSQNIDKIARRVLNESIAKLDLFNGPDEDLRNFFTSGLFSD